MIAVKAYLTMDEIPFTVIVPVYNTEKYLMGCLDSIINQTYTNFEVILVDDGSTDFSGKICDAYAQKYDFIRAIHQENAGVSAARNVGLDNACGDWIVFVDSDDVIEPDMLAVVRKAIFRTRADLFHFNTRIIDEKRNVLDERIFTAENDCLNCENEEIKFKYFFYQLMQYKGGWEVWTRVFKKSLIDKNHLRFYPMESVFAEDFLFTFQYTLYARRMYVICNILYNYVHRNGSLTNDTVSDEKNFIYQLYNFAVIGYKTVKKSRLLYFKENYYKLYFLLLDYHFNHVLSGVPEEVIFNVLRGMNKKYLHCRWILNIRKSIKDLEMYEGNIKWLKRKKF